MQKNPRLRPALLKFVLRIIGAFRTGQGRFSVYEEIVLRLELVENSEIFNLQGFYRVKDASTTLSMTAVYINAIKTTLTYS